MAKNKKEKIIYYDDKRQKRTAACSETDIDLWREVENVLVCCSNDGFSHVRCVVNYCGFVFSIDATRWKFLKIRAPLGGSFFM